MEHLDETLKVEPIKPPTLAEAASNLVELKAEKVRLAKATKTNNEEVDAAQDTLWELMIDADLQSLVHAGHSFSLSEVMYASPAAGCGPDVYQWLKDNDYADLVKETVNAQTLAATVREMMEDSEGVKDVANIPEDLAALLSIFPKKTISVTKKR